jgi:hypothetical protein
MSNAESPSPEPPEDSEPNSEEQAAPTIDGEGFLGIREGEYSEMLDDFVAEIYGVDKHYIVFLNQRNRIWIAGDFGAAVKDVWPKLVLLQNKPVDGLSESHLTTFRRLMGSAAVESFAADASREENATEPAFEILRDADRYRLERLGEVSRRWMLWYTAMIACGMSLVGCLVYWPLREWLASGVGDTVPRIFVAAAFGSIGAFVSVCSRVGSWTVSPESGKSSHFAEAFARVSTGAIAAAAFAMAVHAGLILSDVADGHQFLLVQTLSLFAGISERAIPHLTRQLPGASLFGPSGDDPPKSSAKSGA